MKEETEHQTSSTEDRVWLCREVVDFMIAFLGGASSKGWRRRVIVTLTVRADMMLTSFFNQFG